MGALPPDVPPFAPLSSLRPPPPPPLGWGTRHRLFPKENTSVTMAMVVMKKMDPPLTGLALMGPPRIGLSLCIPMAVTVYAVFQRFR